MFCFVTPEAYFRTAEAIRMSCRLFTLLLTVSFSSLCLQAQQSFTGPAQAGRGFELFSKTAKPLACNTCHAIGGTAEMPAPNLKMWSKLAPRATAMAIRSTITEKVLQVVTKQGSFPATKVAEDDKSIRVFDLSQTPPVARTIAKADLVSAKTDTVWKHPPGTEKFMGTDLADIVAYIRWAGNADKKAIAADDVL